MYQLVNGVEVDELEFRDPGDEYQYLISQYFVTYGSNGKKEIRNYLIDKITGEVSEFVS